MSLPAISSRLLDAASTLATKVAASLNRLGLVETTHHISWSTGVSVGEVTIETADDVDYTGTWAPVAVITFAGTAPKQDYARVQGTYGAIRHRLSVAVTGGTVTTKIEGSV